MVDQRLLDVFVIRVADKAAVRVGLKEVVDPASCSPYLGLPNEPAQVRQLGEPFDTANPCCRLLPVALGQVADEVGLGFAVLVQLEGEPDFLAYRVVRPSTSLRCRRM